MSIQEYSLADGDGDAKYFKVETAQIKSKTTKPNTIEIEPSFNNKYDAYIRLYDSTSVSGTYLSKQDVVDIITSLIAVVDMEVEVT